MRGQEHVESPSTKSQGRVQTIEATGKTWKGAQVAGVVVMLLGVGSCVLGGGGGAGFAGFMLFIAGAAVCLLADIGAWWEHG